MFEKPLEISKNRPLTEFGFSYKKSRDKKPLNLVTR